jgi:beta-lactamase class D
MATALRFSALWYFQALARRLGPAREQAYLERLGYGNTDSSSGLETFWLYQSLAISPDEQARFLLRLYEDALPIDRHAQQVVRDLLIQPAGVVVNGTGEHPFAQPWPADAVVSTKTGSASEEDRPDVRWLVGHVRRGSRSWIFVSNVVGDDLPPLAAVDLAAGALKKAGVL